MEEKIIDALIEVVENGIPVEPVTNDKLVDATIHQIKHQIDKEEEN